MHAEILGYIDITSNWFNYVYENLMDHACWRRVAMPPCLLEYGGRMPLIFSRMNFYPAIHWMVVWDTISTEPH